MGGVAPSGVGSPRPVNADHLILVVTSSADTHVTPVGRRLQELGVPWVRLNTDDLFTNTSLHLEAPYVDGKVQVLDSGRILDLGDVTGVWYRKPDTPATDHLDAESPLAGRFYEAESYENLLNLYAILCDKPWINSPFATRLAHRRFYQLKVARDVGFSIPRSVFSNEPDRVLDFAGRVPSSLAIKTLSPVVVSVPTQGHSETAVPEGLARHQYGVITRPVTREQLEGLRPNIENFPTFIQEYIDKQFDLRITCVGREVFACRIHSQEVDRSRYDFRLATKHLRHELINVPSVFVDKLHEYMEIVGLKFGCFDFVETSDGQMVFLECNPNGQWLWIEKLTGAPISSAIAEFMLSPEFR